MDASRSCHFSQRWIVCNLVSVSLKRVKFSPGLSRYLLFDDGPTAIARARFRFDRALLRASMHKRALTEDPNCQLCDVPETVHHALADCPRYDNFRATARAQ